MKILKHLIAFAFILGMSSMASAAVPPPPVNQNMGIPDTTFINLDASVCNGCHGELANRPVGVPVKPGKLSDRHHLFVYENREIDGLPDFPPKRDADGDGVNDTTFKCTNCHDWELDPDTGVNEIVTNFRNCLNCHKWEAGKTTVHHKTEWAQAGSCFLCHGGIVRGINPETLEGKRPDPANPGETVKVFVSNYDTTLVTPWRSGKPNGDDRPEFENSAGTQPGNCNYCHNTADGLEGTGTPEPYTLTNGTIATVNVFTNLENHHGTGFAAEGKCTWCHTPGEIAGTVKNEIKSCQRCHDTPTLHNIEFDAVGDGVQPGQEEAFFGHIGNQKNCWGCHGFNGTTPLTNQSLDNRLGGDASTAIVPILDSLSVHSTVYGTETVIKATGSSFVNTARLTKDGVPYDHVYTSKVMLRDIHDNVTIIEPTTIDEKTLTFTLPKTMSIGNYTVMMTKAFQHTNPLPLAITPDMGASHAFIFKPYGSLVVLIGSGFTDGFEMATVKGGGTALVAQNGAIPKIYIWRDDLIIAEFAEDPESVKLTNIFNEATFTLETIQ